MLRGGSGGVREDSMAFETLRIGRGSAADVRLADRTVSRLHAEVVVTGRGRFFVTDRGSGGGTWVFRNGRWTSHRQGYVEPHQLLRFGRCEVRLDSVLETGFSNQVDSQPRAGRVSVTPRRSNETGEIEFWPEESR